MDLREQVLEEKEAFRGRVIRLKVARVRLPDGRESVREIVHHPDSVCAMVRTEGRILLVRQFRLAAGSALWEIPAGKMEPGETPEEAILREVEEETGARVRLMGKLAEFLASPGFLTETLHLFLADVVSRQAQRQAQDEAIQVGEFTLEECREMVRRKDIRDAKSLVGIFSLATLGHEVR